MADFNSDFWNWYITILTVISILACVWLLRWMTADYKKSGGEVESTGHVWDGDLSELNNPMPRWWLGLFYITIAFSGFYLLLYPGLALSKESWAGLPKALTSRKSKTWTPGSDPCSSATSKPRFLI